MLRQYYNVEEMWVFFTHGCISSLPCLTHNFLEYNGCTQYESHGDTWHTGSALVQQSLSATLHVSSHFASVTFSEMNIILPHDAR